MFVVYRARRDSTHPEVVAALRKAGAEVVDLAAVGGGCPDLLVLYRDRIFLIEVKAKAGPKGGVSHRKLRASQEAFRAKGWPVLVVRGGQEAVDMVALEPVKHGTAEAARHS